MIFEQSQHIDPHSLPFHDLPSKGEGPACQVTLLHTGYLHSTREYWADDAWEKDEKKRAARKDEPYSLPITMSVVRHPKYGVFTWDLGYDPDNDRLPAVLGKADLPRDCTPAKILAKLGIELSELKGIIWSHCHVDHYGLLTDYPTSVPVYVGEGSLEWLNGGDKAEGGLASFPSDFLTGGWKFTELGSKSSMPQRAIGPFEHAIDFFGDGSMFVVKTPGHCPGHLSLLVRVNNDNDYAFLAADAAHDQHLYLPVPKKPYSVEEDRRAVPGQFKMAPKDTNWACMQDFPDKAFRTLSGLTRLEMEPNVIVLPAHEVEATNALKLSPGDTHELTNWRKDGLKEKKHELGRQRAERLSQL